MSDWKVIVDRIEIFPHPNADKMELGRVGSFQVVVGKSIYKTGDAVVFAPKRSILPPDLRKYFVNEDTGHSYLRGPNEDRVGSIRLRGEESEGVIIPPEWLKDKEIPENVIGSDISKALGIEEYVPELHSVSARKHTQDGDNVQPVHEAVTLDRFVRHDVEQFRIFQNEFIAGETVTLTEKIHGSQINVIKDRFGRISVTSKGRAEKNLVLREYPLRKLWSGRTLWKKVLNFVKVVLGIGPPPVMNEYWRYAYDSGIIDFVRDYAFDGVEIQVIGEVIPLQNGFSYGFSKQTVLVFRVIVDTKDLSYGVYSNAGLTWVPILYQGAYPHDEAGLKELIAKSKGLETVSGKGLHIREGAVLQPSSFRRTKSGVPLIVKLINPAYKETNDDLR